MGLNEGYICKLVRLVKARTSEVLQASVHKRVFEYYNQGTPLAPIIMTKVGQLAYICVNHVHLA